MTTKLPPRHKPLRVDLAITSPFALALASSPALALETLTHSTFSRTTLFGGTAPVIELEEGEEEDDTETHLPHFASGDDDEVVSAAIRYTRYSVVPVAPDQEDDKEIPSQKRKLRRVSPQAIQNPQLQPEVHQIESDGIVSEAESEEEEEGSVAVSSKKIRPSVVTNASDETPLCAGATEVPSQGKLDAPLVLDIRDDDAEEAQYEIGDPDEQINEAKIHQGCPNVRTWKRRKYFFSKFDEGIEMDASAWYEVSPEHLARHVAKRISLTVNVEKGDEPEEVIGKASGGKRKKRKRGGQENQNDTQMGTARKILAACSGVGGDAIALALWSGTQVTAVDLDAHKLELLRTNAKVYGVESRIETVHADLIKFAEAQLAEVESKEWVEIVQMPVQVKKQDFGSLHFEVKRTKLVRPFSWCVLSPPWGGPSYKDQYVFRMSDQTFADLIGLVQSSMRICDNVCLILPRSQDIYEVIHLAARGSPDSERFPYIEVELLAEKDGRPPKYAAVYLCRDPLLILMDRKPPRTKPFYSKRTTELLKKNLPSEPTVENPLPELPTISVALKFLAEAKASQKGILSPIQFQRMVIIKFLLHYLEEPKHLIRVTTAALEVMGIFDFLDLVEQSLMMIRKGGMKRGDGAPRTKGGVFFELLRQRYPDCHKILQKWRKRETAEFKNMRSRKAEPAATTDFTDMTLSAKSFYGGVDFVGAPPEDDADSQDEMADPEDSDEATHSNPLLEDTPLLDQSNASNTRDSEKDEATDSPDHV